MKYDLKVDMKELGAALRKIKGNTSDNLRQACLAGLFTLEAHAKINIKETFNQGTGNLSSNFETVIDEVSNTKASGHVSPLAIYARIQELGGVIRATNAPALHFQTKDGQWHTVKAVTIPARPYLRPAADVYQDEIFASVAAVLKQVIEGR